MKIVLAGGSGQIGRFLEENFVAAGHEVVVLSRGVRARKGVVSWNGRTLGPWIKDIDGADVVVNLAGRSVNCRYSAAHRREILESRVRSTEVLGEAIRRAERPPRLWLQSSTATIYAHRDDSPNTERDGRIGGDETGVPDTWRFSVEVAKAWERAAEAARRAETRLVLLRTAIVMSPSKGGAFALLHKLARWGLAGPQGDGRQFISWIHEEDFRSALCWLIEHEEVSGAVNLSSPHPVRNAEFLAALRRASGGRRGLPAPAWLLEIGAFFLRTETELLLKSRYVVPERLVQGGFRFRYPRWHDAVGELCGRVV